MAEILPIRIKTLFNQSINMPRGLNGHTVKHYADSLNLKHWLRYGRVKF